MIDHWEIEVKSTPKPTLKIIKILEECGATVKQNGDEILLIHPEVSADLSYEIALTHAKKLITSLNFVIQRLHGISIDLLFKDIIGYAADGGKYLFVTINESVKMYCNIEVEHRNSEGKIIEEPELPTIRWKDLLLKDPDVSLICELLSKEPKEWNNLYKVLEIISKNIGGLEKIHNLEWATKESIRRFKHTANSPSTIGLNARHGVDQGRPPSSPMIYTEASALIDTIVYQWIGSKT